MNHRIAILHDPCYLEFPVNVEKTHVSAGVSIKNLQENFQSEIEKKSADIELERSFGVS